MRRNFLSNSACITTLETNFNVTFTVSLLNMYTYLQKTVAKTSEYFVLIFTFFMSSNVYTTPKCLGTHNIRGDQNHIQPQESKTNEYHSRFNLYPNMRPKFHPFKTLYSNLERGYEGMSDAFGARRRGREGDGNALFNARNCFSTSKTGHKILLE